MHVMAYENLFLLSSADPSQRRYAVVAQGLRGRILSGEWAGGISLPAEQDLARQYAVALGTMRQALQLLVQEGLIDRVHGRGTFVKQVLTGAPMMRFFRFGQTEMQPPQSLIVERSICHARSFACRASFVALAHVVGQALLAGRDLVTASGI
jgi:GntR family transcriptional regulator